MKNVFTIITLLMLSGCGIAEDFGSTHCGGTLKDLCHMITGGKTDETQNAELLNHESRVADLERRILQVELNIESNMQQLNLLNNQYVELGAENDMLDQAIDSVQAQTNVMLAQLATLLGYNTVTSIITPCPSNTSPSGYRESILRTSNNDLLAYFESGSRRFLTKLKPNANYILTDGSGCGFSVGPNMEVSW